MNQNERVRVWTGKTFVALLVIGLIGWIGYREIRLAKANATAAQSEMETLRIVRFTNIMTDLEFIEKSGDEKIQERARHAIDLLSKMEPWLYENREGLKKLIK